MKNAKLRKHVLSEFVDPVPLPSLSNIHSISYYVQMTYANLDILLHDLGTSYLTNNVDFLTDAISSLSVKILTLFFAFKLTDDYFLFIYQSLSIIFFSFFFPYTFSIPNFINFSTFLFDLILILLFSSNPIFISLFL